MRSIAAFHCKLPHSLLPPQPPTPCLPTCAQDPCLMVKTPMCSLVFNQTRNRHQFILIHSHSQPDSTSSLSFPTASKLSQSPPAPQRAPKDSSLRADLQSDNAIILSCVSFRSFLACKGIPALSNKAREDFSSGFPGEIILLNLDKTAFIYLFFFLPRECICKIVLPFHIDYGSHVQTCLSEP